MSSSLIEQTRLVHQDLEKHMSAMVDDLLVECKSTKDRILQETRVKMRMELMADGGRALSELYDDTDGGARKTELEDMAGEEVFGTFYEKLKDIRDYYRKFPDTTPQVADYEIKPKVKFNGAEVGGTFLDLHPFFERYVNMPVFSRCDYLTFLTKFDNFSEIPQAKKFLPFNFSKYKQYLTDLSDYLLSFQSRTNPLAEMDVLVGMINEEFSKLWKDKKVVGWAAKAEEDKKEEEPSNDHPLYCSACRKLFKSTNTYTSHLAGRKHKKSVQQLGQKKEDDPRGEELARLEFLILSLTDLLKEVVEGTRDYMVKKQTRTFEEIAADLEEQQNDDELSDSESEEEEQVIHNPLNLPLGWDGKPIPFWLYKLHGLNIEYKCDVCGGFTYRGPRAYERHFSEWRHTYGLRCLGITNSKAFLHITKFEDAIALHEKLQAKGNTSSWKPDEEEEFEDDEGNVFNKKTYDDLKRQGII